MIFFGIKSSIALIVQFLLLTF